MEHSDEFWFGVGIKHDRINIKEKIRNGYIKGIDDDILRRIWYFFNELSENGCYCLYCLYGCLTSYSRTYLTSSTILTSSTTLTLLFCYGFALSLKCYSKIIWRYYTWWTYCIYWCYYCWFYSIYIYFFVFNGALNSKKTNMIQKEYYYE